MNQPPADAATRRYWSCLLALVALGLAFRFGLALILPPGYDESYYLFYGQNLALSYYDHPLLVGLWAAAGQALGDISGIGPVLALRLPGLLSYSAAIVLLAEATRRWFETRAALLAAALASLSPLIFACGGLLLLPDSPLILMLALLLWWLAGCPLNARRTPRQSLLFGLILGGLSLGKYHALVLILTLVVLRLIHSLRQGELRWRDTALVLAGWLAASWPLWLWNLQNGWLSFSFHAARTGSAGGYRLEGPPLFLLSQLALLFPTIGVLVVAALLRPAPQSSVRGREATALLRWLALPQLLLFTLLAGRMQVLSSWLVPAWWLLLPLAAARLAAPGTWEQRWVRRLGLVSAAAVPALSLTAAAHVRWGIASALLPPAADTSGQLLAPANLRQALQEHPAIWQALRQAQVIGSNRYELPGFLALALKGYSRASYTAYTSDSRGFDQWRQQLDPTARRGVLFAVVGDYAPLASLASSQPGQPWQFGSLRPLGQVQVLRRGQPAALLEFYSFDPSELRAAPARR